MNLQSAAETAVGAEALLAPKPQLAVPQRTSPRAVHHYESHFVRRHRRRGLLDQNDER